MAEELAEFWYAELINRRGYSKGRLGGVLSGSLDWSIFRSVEGSGSIEIDLDPGLDIDWMSDRIRIIHHAPGGEETRWGTWMIAAPERQTTPTTVRTSMQLLDATETLNQPIGGVHSVPAGRRITAEIEDIFKRRSGWPWYTVEPQDSRLPTAIVPDPDTTWLQLANDLAAMVGYSSVRADRDGVLRCDPYVPVAQRTPLATYGPGDSRMLGEWTEEMDLWSVVNIVRVVSEGTDEKPPIIGLAWNYDPDDPTSVAGLGGRSRVRVERAEVASKREATLLARRLLEEESRIMRRATITHPVDETWIDDQVRHDPLDMEGNIVERKVTLGIGPVVEDTIRQQVKARDAAWLES